MLLNKNGGAPRWLVLRAAVKTVVVLAVLAVLLYLLAWAYVWQTERLVEKRWVEVCGSFPTLETLFPEVVKNGSAERFECVVGAAGIEISHPFKYARSSAASMQKWMAIPARSHYYLEVILEDESRLIPALPEDFVSYMDAQRSKLYEARELLLGDDPPIWDVKIEMLMKSPAPHFYSLFRIQEWLLLDAMIMEREGRHSEAMRDLDAGWILNGVLRNRPELQAQICAINVAELYAGAMRKMAGAGREWGRRMDAAPFQSSLEKAFLYEAWCYREGGRSLANASFMRRGNERILWRTFGRLWYRLTLADLESRMLGQIVLFRQMGNCCGTGLAAVQRTQVSPRWWETVGSFRQPNLGEAWGRLVKLKLDLDFTRAIIAIESASIAAGGIWPDEIPEEAGSTCPGLKWVYKPVTGRSPTLSAEISQPLPPKNGTIDIPMVFRF